MPALQSEFEFQLPRGYLDRAGTLHRVGIMRLATARDELLPLLDDRVKANPHYLTVVLLARVITSLGSLQDDEVGAQVVESLYASDLAYLQDFYGRINTVGSPLAEVACPACHVRFTVDITNGTVC